ncbi:hypothetical protein [Pseudohongiella spirulinae]|uniref:Uncharacterized protein n=1 Tax=Pseudohongiella spirulinae TaxID=1249552 RepID=A0A0S2KCT0_9GAMM|nr:hypothetical protein [Pseudohongiella spirulinae]ALO46122.1 hypothetical protein PS2015_1465 [Pseudohongiella spirulinae]
MLALISLILALLLTAAIVIALHRFQETSRAKAADREQSLPPLHLDRGDENESDPAQTLDTDEESDASDMQDSGPSVDWKQQSQLLKDSGDYESALQISQQAWPQWQSYQQAAVIMRAAIRSADAENSDKWLIRLYQLAAQAGFLHDKIDGLPQPGWQTLARQFSLQDLNAMHFDWHVLGYRHMRLLTKTDIRQMSKAWGEPENHQSAKQHYQKVFISQSAY